MASKIEHFCKRNAHQDTLQWAASDTIQDKKSILHLTKEKFEAHSKYCDDMEKSGKYFYGSPPRSKLLNWIGHKFLEWAWGRDLYI